MLVKQQVAALDEQARKIDRQIDSLAAERDVLAQERDGLKAAVAKSQQGKGSYAVLPYKGENGSWRRPIVLECSNGTVTLLPKGPTFSLLDLSSMVNPRSSPVILAIARELLRVQMSESPDGSPVVPYFVFLVRPDGIRPYYEIRARLERLGIAFGYELIDQNLKVDVPDYDNVATWDGTIPLEEPILAAPRSGGPGTGDGGGTGDGLAWPSTGAAAHAGKNGTPSQLAGPAGTGGGDQAAGTIPQRFCLACAAGWKALRGSGGSGGSDSGPAGTGLAQGSGPGTGTGSGAGSYGREGTGAGNDTGDSGRSGSLMGRPRGGAGVGWPGPGSSPGAGSAERTGSAGPGGRGSATGTRPGARPDPALDRWPFPYPPPGAEVADDGDGTGSGAGDGSGGFGGASGPGARRGASDPGGSSGPASSPGGAAQGGESRFCRTWSRRRMQPARLVLEDLLCRSLAQDPARRDRAA